MDGILQSKNMTYYEKVEYIKERLPEKIYNILKFEYEKFYEESTDRIYGEIDIDDEDECFMKKCEYFDVFMMCPHSY